MLFQINSDLKLVQDGVPDISTLSFSSVKVSTVKNAILHYKMATKNWESSYSSKRTVKSIKQFIDAVLRLKEFDGSRSCKSCISVVFK